MTGREPGPPLAERERQGHVELEAVGRAVRPEERAVDLIVDDVVGAAPEPGGGGRAVRWDATGSSVTRPKPSWPGATVSVDPTATKCAGPACGQSMSSLMQGLTGPSRIRPCRLHAQTAAPAIHARALTNAKAAMRGRIGAGPYTNSHGERGKGRAVRITPDNPLVLGSASPRRRDLVAALGVPFVVCSASADEIASRRAKPAQAYVERVTLAKLEAVCAQSLSEPAGVLVADTIVVAPDGALLGKPRDDDEGRAMLERLVGRHAPGLDALRAGRDIARRGPVTDARPDRDHAGHVSRRSSPGEIRAYVASGEGRDKAGSYAVQGNGCRLRRANRGELHRRRRLADLRGPGGPARDRLARAPVNGERQPQWQPRLRYLEPPLLTVR